MIITIIVDCMLRCILCSSPSAFIIKQPKRKIMQRLNS